MGAPLEDVVATAHILPVPDLVDILVGLCWAPTTEENQAAIEEIQATLRRRLAEGSH
jgi:hypothetical protein